MAIVVADPTDEPYGCLHPSFPGKGLRDGGPRWSTVTRYLMGQRVAAPEEPTLRLGLRVYFQADLPSRRVLLSTGEESLDVGLRDARLRPVFNRILEETRSFVRVRAEDRGAIQCGHEDEEEWGRACEHLLFYRGAPPLGRRFTGFRLSRLVGDP